MISTKLVNPDGKNPSIYDPVNDVTYYNATVANHVPYMLRGLAYMWAGLVLIVIVLVTRIPNNEPIEAGIIVTESENAGKQEKCGSLSDSSLPEINDDTLEGQLLYKKPE